MWCFLVILFVVGMSCPPPSLPWFLAPHTSVSFVITKLLSFVVTLHNVLFCLLPSSSAFWVALNVSSLFPCPNVLSVPEFLAFSFVGYKSLSFDSAMTGMILYFLQFRGIHHNFKAYYIQAPYQAPLKVAQTTNMTLDLF